jgi:pyruvate kinase
MILKGVNLFRLNFSHGNHDTYLSHINNIRQIENKLSKPVGLIADLQGPKIRVGKFKNGYIELIKDLIVVLDTQFEELGDINQIGVDYKDLAVDVQKNDILL